MSCLAKQFNSNGTFLLQDFYVYLWFFFTEKRYSPTFRQPCKKQKSKELNGVKNKKM